MTKPIHTDYLVAGAGAMGLAFADEILRSSRKRVVLVDRRAGPGGHWNDAYDFVRLHQAEAFYGVNSMTLGEGGPNLATKPTILAYYREVVERWSATGRLVFLGQCELGRDGRVRSLATGDEVPIVHRRFVDATYSRVQVPATHPPAYAVSPAATLVPVGGLWSLGRHYARYVIIGAGKTALDGLGFLMEHGVGPDRITWIVSRDAWLLDRSSLAPERVGQVVGLTARLMGEAKSLRDVEGRLEEAALWSRIDPMRRPTAFRCATVSPAEIERLRRIDDVVRLGRVRRVEPGRLLLDRGERAVERDALFVDCTADGLPRLTERPVFGADGDITLQPLFVCQQVMSAALIAALDLRLPRTIDRNALAVPVPHPMVPTDYVRSLAITIGNMVRWQSWPSINWWLMSNRLSAISHVPWHRRIPTLLPLLRHGRRWRDGMLSLLGDAP